MQKRFLDTRNLSIMTPRMSSVGFVFLHVSAIGARAWMVGGLREELLRKAVSRIAHPPGVGLACMDEAFIVMSVGIEDLAHGVEAHHSPQCPMCTLNARLGSQRDSKRLIRVRPDSRDFLHRGLQ